MIPQSEQNIINSNIKNFVYEIDWLDSLENVIDNINIDVISGNVNFDDGNNNKRSVDLTLSNLNKQYLPFESSKMQINNKIRLKCGYKYGSNQTLIYNQGIYVLGNPSLLSSPSQKEATLQLLDKYVLIDGTISGSLKNQYIIPVGTRIDAAVKSIITDIIGETNYIVDECTTLTPYTITKEINSTISELLIELCTVAGNYQVFYDNNGTLRFKKVITIEDIDSSPISYEYSTDSGLYLQSTREVKWNDIRNSIVVYGAYDEDTGIQYKATSQDFTGSRFSIDVIGERPKIFELNELYSNELCQMRSDYELLKAIQAQEQVNLDLIPNFSTNLNEIIQVTDANNGISGNYLIQSITYDLSYDSKMTLGLWKVRNI